MHPHQPIVKQRVLYLYTTTFSGGTAGLAKPEELLEMYFSKTDEVLLFLLEIVRHSFSKTEYISAIFEIIHNLVNT